MYTGIHHAVYAGIHRYTQVYTSIHRYTIPVYIPVYAGVILVYIFLCVLVYTCVYWCIPVYTCVYWCIPVYTSV